MLFEPTGHPVSLTNRRQECENYPKTKPQLPTLITPVFEQPQPYMQLFVIYTTGYWEFSSCGPVLLELN